MGKTCIYIYAYICIYINGGFSIATFDYRLVRIYLECISRILGMAKEALDYWVYAMLFSDQPLNAISSNFY